MRRLGRFALSLTVAGVFAASSFVFAWAGDHEGVRLVAQARAKPADAGGATKATKVGPGGTTTVTTVTKVEVTGTTTATKVEAAGKTKVKEKVAAKAVVRNHAQRVESLTQQFVGQLRPLLRAEYYRLCVLASPSPDQRRRFAWDGEQVLWDTARKLVEQQQRVRPVLPGQAPVRENPRALIQDGLKHSAKAVLSPALLSQYEKEVADREQARKDTTICNLVATLDEALIFSAGQREKIMDSMRTHWNDAWCPSLEILMSYQQIFPNIPEQHVGPFLNAQQKKIWNALPKADLNSFGGFGFVWGGLQNAPGEDEALRDARLAFGKQHGLLGVPELEQ